jgi:phosphatidylglycerophosphate synthase
MYGCFTHQEIEVVKTYKYNVKVDSICAKFLRPFWNWLIEFFPLTIAPNLITLIGFLFEVVSFLISAIYSHGFVAPIPSYCCFFNGFSLFMYQTLDNLDGRQARRTQMSSPLGQFFDHGCDAITGVLEMMKVGASLNLACNRFMFFLSFFMAIGFFLTSWQEYVTHVFYFAPINGPVEGLLFLVLLHILAGFIPNINSMIKFPIMELIFYVGFFITVLSIIYDVIKKTFQDPSLIKTAIFPLIPLLMTVFLFFVNYFSLNGDINASFIFAAGLLPQFQSQQLIVSHLVNRNFWKQIDFSMWILWGFLIISLIFKNIIFIEYWTFYSFILFCFLLFFDFRVIKGLSAGLNIPIFTVINQNIENNVLDLKKIEDETKFKEEIFL